ncbi:MAG: hypothetical protein ACRDZ8_16355 [Acidimicrobiales bacterium]
MESAPTEHLAYVNEVNKQTGIEGAAKKLARLAEAWKYYNNVPVSSFYLEMRAARCMAGEKAWVAVMVVFRFFEHLE